MGGRGKRGHRLLLPYHEILAEQLQKHRARKHRPGTQGNRSERGACITAGMRVGVGRGGGTGRGKAAYAAHTAEATLPCKGRRFAHHTTRDGTLHSPPGTKSARRC